ncbi:MAG: hypothetical protein Q8R13_02570, partial [bacterium]|nr:hypothetical protein [bacterium]
TSEHASTGGMTMEYRWTFALLPPDLTMRVADDEKAVAVALGTFRHSLTAPVRRKMVAMLILVYGRDGRLEEERVALTLDEEFSLERFTEELRHAEFPGDFAADRDLFLRRESYVEYPVRASRRVHCYRFFTDERTRQWYRIYLQVMGRYLEMAGLPMPSASFYLEAQLLVTAHLLDVAEETDAVLGQMFSQHLLWTGQAASMRSR